MNCRWLVEQASRILEPAEREVVLGDLAEARETSIEELREVLGLAFRRQMELLNQGQLWLVLLGLAAPLGLLVSLASSRVAEENGLYAWMYFGNADLALLRLRAFWIVLAQVIALVSPETLALACLSWTIGFVLGAAARRAAIVNGAWCGLALLFGAFVVVPWYTQFQIRAVFGTLPLNLRPAGSFGCFAPTLPLFALVVLPAARGMWHGARSARLSPALRTLLWTPVLGTLALAFFWQAIFWTGVATHNQVLLQRSWQLPCFQLAIAGPAAYLIAWTSQKHFFRRVI